MPLKYNLNPGQYRNISQLFHRIFECTGMAIIGARLENTGISDYNINLCDKFIIEYKIQLNEIMKHKFLFIPTHGEFVLNCMF